MVIFFLLVGLEIEREIYDGELSTVKKASLPAIAASGGMLIPSLIHFIFNAGNLLAKGGSVSQWQRILLLRWVYYHFLVTEFHFRLRFLLLHLR